MHIFLNVAIYQGVWFLCVFLENLGALLALPLIALHLLLSSHKRKDLHLMALLLAAGMLLDGSLHAVEFFSFNAPGYPIPLWLAVIWIALASLPHHSLKWLKGRPVLSALLGGIGGPFAYYAGVRAGAADFQWPLMTSLTTLTLLWAFLWPAVMYYAERMGKTEKLLTNGEGDGC